MFAGKKVRRVSLIASCLLVAAAAKAQQAVVNEQPVVSPPAPAAPVLMRTSEAANQIAEINERMSVMQAQLAQLELQAKIAAKNDEIRRFGKAPETVDDGFTPAVVEINGMDRKLTANLMVQGGNVQTVRVGDKVGPWEVRSITVDTVTMVRGKDVKRLGFGSYIQAPVQSGQANIPGQQIPGMPMAMPLPR